MNEEQDGVRSIRPAHVHHLLRTAQRGLERFLNAIRRDDAVDVGDDRMSVCVRVWRGRRLRRAGGRGYDECEQDQDQSGQETVSFVTMRPIGSVDALTTDRDRLLLQTASRCLPSGNERGANDKWVPGGYTSGRVIEAVMDFPASLPFKELKL